MRSLTKSAALLLSFFLATITSHTAYAGYWSDGTASRAKTSRNIPERKCQALVLRNWLLPILGFFVVAASGIAGCSSGGSDATVVRAETTEQDTVQSTTTVAPTPEEEVIEDLRQTLFILSKALETPEKGSDQFQNRLSGAAKSLWSKSLERFKDNGWKTQKVDIDQFDIDQPEVNFKGPDKANVRFCLIDRTVVIDKFGKPRGSQAASFLVEAQMQMSEAGTWNLTSTENLKEWEDVLGCDR